MQETISICDREADIFEYLHYKQQKSQRFIVRASHNRLIENKQSHLFDKSEKAAVLGQYEIKIPQKGGRKARKAILELRACRVKINRPKRLSEEWEDIELNLVVAQEIGALDKDGLKWLLLTSEPIKSFASARQIARYYELRWRVEDFHKAW